MGGLRLMVFFNHTLLIKFIDLPFRFGKTKAKLASLIIFYTLDIKAIGLNIYV
jgi:hypothetical protein